MQLFLEKSSSYSGASFLIYKQAHQYALRNIALRKIPDNAGQGDNEKQSELVYLSNNQHITVRLISN